MSQDINHDRRRFVCTAAMTLAAALLGVFGSAKAQFNETNTADGSSRASMRTGSSRAASGTICLKKPPQAFAAAVVAVDGY